MAVILGRPPTRFSLPAVSHANRPAAQRATFRKFFGGPPGQKAIVTVETDGRGIAIVKGPHPKSGYLKLVDGNRGRRPINRAEPKPKPSIPPPPDVLGVEARAEWMRVAPLLLAGGVLADIDRAALAAYCVAYGRWQQAERLLADSELVLTTAKRGTVTNPLLRVATRAQADMVRYAAEFGMSPASRSRVWVIDGKPSAEDAFFPAS